MWSEDALDNTLVVVLIRFMRFSCSPNYGRHIRSEICMSLDGPYIGTGCVQIKMFTIYQSYKIYFFEFFRADHDHRFNEKVEVTDNSINI